MLDKTGNIIGLELKKEDSGTARAIMINFY